MEKKNPTAGNPNSISKTQTSCLICLNADAGFDSVCFGGVICVETRPPEIPVKYHLEHLLQDSADQ